LSTKNNKDQVFSNCLVVDIHHHDEL